jgi:hypothetical protein
MNADHLTWELMLTRFSATVMQRYITLKVAVCRYGFQGFYNSTCKPIVLTNSTVDNIQLQGGTILGTSRGGANIREIVKRIDMWGVNMLFVVGGNGGNAGANAIQQLCEQVALHISLESPSCLPILALFFLVHYTSVHALIVANSAWPFL